MTDIKARLDEIAKEAAVTWESLVLAHMLKPSGEFPDQASHIRAAIDKALEVALTAEPSEKALEVAVDAYTGYQSPADRGYAQQEEGMRLAHRAMSSALLEELKK